MTRVLILLAIAVAGAAAYWMTRPFSYETGAPLEARTGPVALFDGLDRLDTAALPEGWLHRTFFRVPPTEYDLTESDGSTALRCRTRGSASILARDTRIALADLPILSWRWKVTQPIESDLDEATEEGDDHPLRFYLRFENEQGETRSAEVIWSNRKFAPGEYKIIGSFYHYVANGRAENVGRWHDQRLDLRMLYSDIGGTGTPTLTALGFFCDSDNTGGRSDGLIADIILSAPAPEKTSGSAN